MAFQRQSKLTAIVLWGGCEKNTLLSHVWLHGAHHSAKKARKMRLRGGTFLGPEAFCSHRKFRYCSECCTNAAFFLAGSFFQLESRAVAMTATILLNDLAFF